MLLNARQRVSGAYTMRCCSCTPPGSVYGVNRGAAAVLLKGRGGRRQAAAAASEQRGPRSSRRSLDLGGQKATRWLEGQPPCVLETVRPLQSARPALGLLRPMCCIAHTDREKTSTGPLATHGTAILVGAPGPLLLAFWRFQRLVAAAPAQRTRATMCRLGRRALQCPRRRGWRAMTSPLCMCARRRNAPTHLADGHGA